jgi:hypothetical protein
MSGSSQTRVSSTAQAAGIADVRQGLEGRVKGDADRLIGTLREDLNGLFDAAFEGVTTVEEASEVSAAVYAKINRLMGDIGSLLDAFRAAHIDTSDAGNQEAETLDLFLLSDVPTLDDLLEMRADGKDEEIGEAIKEMANDPLVSNREMATAIGVNSTHMTSMLDGKAVFTEEMLRALYYFLNIHEL